ncbi:MAG: outer membrane beta-barrel protein [Gemmatimonadetes bacterium]|nr:outer membrane beta-barrel protein [Gemmatimonadota bacterium]
MRRKTTGWVPLTIAALAVAAPLEAQTAQRFSVQISALGNTLFGEDFEGLKTGFGGEAQVRYNPSAFSIGAGIQYTYHDVDLESLGLAQPGFSINSSLVGFFVEPRYVFDMGSDRAAPYLSSRFSVSNLTLKAELDGVGAELTDTGLTVNAGGGVLVRLNQRANLDFGATFGYKQLGVISSGAGEDASGSGTNIIYRFGVAFGLGG